MAVNTPEEYYKGESGCDYIKLNIDVICLNVFEYLTACWLVELPDTYEYVIPGMILIICHLRYDYTLLGAKYKPIP